MPTAEGGTLAIHRDADGKETRRIETKPDGTEITKTGGHKKWGSTYTLEVYKGADGKETKQVKTFNDSDETVITTRPNGDFLETKKGVNNRVKSHRIKVLGKDHKIETRWADRKFGGDPKETSRVETKPDGSTITTTVTIDEDNHFGIEELSRDAVHRDASGKETKRVHTKIGDFGKIISTITTTPKGDGTLVVYRDASGEETKRVETKRDGTRIEKRADGTEVTTLPDKSTITREGGGPLVVYRDAGGKETKRVERKGSTEITTTPTAEGGTLAVRKVYGPVPGVPELQISGKRRA